MVKAWRFAKWLGGYDLYPLLSLNFFFRFSFAAYKSVFAFFCMAMLNFEKKQVCRDAHLPECTSLSVTP